jgi:serine/threonine protein kinase
MDQYTISKQVNSGAFGQVYKAIDNKTGHVVISAFMFN